MIFEVTYNETSLLCQPKGLPELYDKYRKHTTLGEEFDLNGQDDGQLCFIGVKKNSDWPFLTIAQRYSPAGYGFNPGALLIPEMSLLFVGAGKRLLLYDLEEPKRLWSDSADTGFWHWHRHGDFVLMAAELEFAAWSKEGAKLWSAFVEPPWDYEVVRDSVVVNVMGKKRTFDLRYGPQNKSGA